MGAQPLYRDVYQELIRRIDSGLLSRGAALPSETNLTKEFGVSLITVRRAIHEMELDGLIIRRQGMGNFVRDVPRGGLVIGLSNFTSSVATGRLRIVRTLLVDDMISAKSDIAEKLRVQAGSMLRHLVRMDCEGGVPLSVDEVFIPPALASCVDREIASSPLFLHLWQQRSSIHLVRTFYQITARTPGVEDQRLLMIGPEVPLLITDEAIADTSKRTVMCLQTRHRADRCCLSATVPLMQTRTQQGPIGE
jgi:DNA-binding GntR family transcriptional regulator